MSENTTVVVTETLNVVTVDPTGSVTVLLEEPVVTVLLEEPVVQLITALAQGPEGIPGPAGIGSVLPGINFSYGDATPAQVTSLVGGRRVLKVQLTIDVAFNGTGATLSVGTTLDPVALMPVLDAATAATYETSPQLVYGSNTPVFLFITPGSGASAGSGTVLIQSQ